MITPITELKYNITNRDTWTWRQYCFKTELWNIIIINY